MSDNIWKWKNLLSNTRYNSDSELKRNGFLAKLYNIYFPKIKDTKDDEDSCDINLYSSSIISSVKKKPTTDKIGIQKTKVEKNPFSVFDDTNRIVSSSAFRRLQNKTQVYPLEKHDYVRTRLTHSIEVSCIAESILRQINEIKTFKDKTFSIYFDRILCCLKNGGLIHDIGNPPFGHYGEDAIKNFFVSKWDKLEYYEIDDLNKLDGKSVDIYNTTDNIKSKLFKEIIKKTDQEYMDFSSFDGNAQAFRIINSTQPFASGNGLNLTCATLGAVLKYPNNSLKSNDNHGKFGYYFSEDYIIQRLKANKCYFEGKKNPVALIMEAADDISNLVNDFIDAIKKNKVTQSDIIFLKKKYDDPFMDSLDLDSNDFDLLKIVSEKTEVLKQVLITSVAEEFSIHYDDIMSGEYTDTLMKGRYKNTAKDTDKTFPVSKGEPELPIKIRERKSIIDILHDIFASYVYNNSDIVSLELQGERIISFLLEHFLTAVLELNLDKDWKNEAKTRNQKIVQLISSDYISVYLKAIEEKKDSKNVLYNKIHLVVDHICGMTDEYAKETYKIIMGII